MTCLAHIQETPVGGLQKITLVRRSPVSGNIPDEFCKKFAELIVRECSAFVNHFSDGHEKDQFGRKMFHYRADIGQVILEHFGVEE